MSPAIFYAAAQGAQPRGYQPEWAVWLFVGVGVLAVAALAYLIWALWRAVR